MSRTITVPTQLVTVDCAKCGVVYAIPAGLFEQITKPGGPHTRCPNGHAWYNHVVLEDPDAMRDELADLRRKYNTLLAKADQQAA